MPLLERDEVLAEVAGRVEAAGARRGSLVLVSGEAGIGKSALVARVAEEAARRRARVMVGACDALATPRPLGPFHDIATAGGEHELLALLSASPAREQLFGGFLALLRRGGPAVVVVEDLQWADEATLDVLRHLARRVAEAPAVLLVTYRDDELDEHHPLRAWLGDVSTAARLLRARLEPLSPVAVAVLAGPGRTDVADLHRRTGGNPFFVTEVIATGGDRMPAAVRDAVLARASRLSPAAREVLDAVAVVPPRVELDLLLALCPGSEAAVDECERRGMLVPDGAGVRFRHELARTAVESDVAATHRVRLHRGVLAWLLEQGGPSQLARLVHHAAAAGDVDAVLELAPRAAERSARLGAHREAAAHYATAVAAGEDRLPAADLAELLAGEARARQTSDQIPLARRCVERALALWRSAGDLRRVGESLECLARVLMTASLGAEALAAADEAVAVLETLPPGRELAAALATRARLAMRADDHGGALAFGERAIALAESLGEEEVLVYSLVNVGSSEFEHAPDGAVPERLEEAIRRARAGGLHEHYGRALLNLGTVHLFHRRYGPALAAYEEAIPYCEDHGLDTMALLMRTERARVALETGDLDAAGREAGDVLARASAEDTRVVALVVLGRVRALRGDPGVAEALDAAWAIARRQEEVQFLGPVAAARLEAALLAGREAPDVVADAVAALRLATERGTAWWEGALGVWLARAGCPRPSSRGVPEPWALELAGRPAEAGDAWRRLGCPYEAAMTGAWASPPDEARARRAVEELQLLGAVQAATVAARRLRERGVRGVPRGAQRTTRANPAGLTRREADVLSLLAEGLTNQEIAARLFLSGKTVEHHVGAVLRKLGARTRAAAVAEARRAGALTAP